MRIRVITAMAAVTAVLAVGVPASVGGDAGEIWLPSESGAKVYIVDELGSIEEVTDPAILKPHIVTFSANGELAFVSDVGNGNLNILDADTRTVSATIPGSAFGGGPDTHQAKPSPHEDVLLVARRAIGGTEGRLFKVEWGTWAILDSTTFPSGKFPICTVFSPDGTKAYVSTGPSGIAIVDVATLDVLDELPTNGSIACGLSLSKDGKNVYVTSNGGSGSTTGWFYRLHIATDTLSAGRHVPATDLHWNVQSPNGRRIFATARGSEELKVLNRRGALLKSIPLNATAGPDSPDGADVKGSTVYVALKDSGKLAVVNPYHGTVSYLDVAPPATSVLPHVTVRP